jgi:hypothetical protein
MAALHENSFQQALIMMKIIASRRKGQALLARESTVLILESPWVRASSAAVRGSPSKIMTIATFT